MEDSCFGLVNILDVLDIRMAEVRKINNYFLIFC